jgi:transketolase C-terminal domain/subunit
MSGGWSRVSSCGSTLFVLPPRRARATRRRRCPLWTLIEAAEATGSFVTVEDHYPEGGIGDAVLEVFADKAERPPIAMLAVREMPTSGTPDEILASAGIDRAHIVEAVRTLVAQPLASA